MSAAATTERMPIPDTGELDAPIRPAIYPQTAAISRPMTTMNKSAPAISTPSDPASGPPVIKLHSRMAIGTSIAREPMKTTAIGRSCSSIASASPE